MLISFFLLGCTTPPALKTESYKCWNEINFEEKEKILLTSSIEKKIPFYKYKYQKKLSKQGSEKESIKKDFFRLKESHEENSPVFVLIYHNGLKAIFKEKKRWEWGKTSFSRSFYSPVFFYKVSRLFGLKVVPPTVLRKIDGNWGSVQLFVENIPKTLSEIKSLLDSRQKSNIYILTFLMGMQDLNNNNILISKNCLRPALIDNDSMKLLLSQYGKYPPFRRFNRAPDLYLSEKDYENAPFEKSVKLAKPSSRDLLKALEKILSLDEQRDDRRIIKRFIMENKESKNVFYFKYKNTYWFSFLQELKWSYFKSVFFPYSFGDFSPKTLKNLKRLSRENLETIYKEVYGKKDGDYFGNFGKSLINGIVHRKKLLLKEVEKVSQSN